MSINCVDPQVPLTKIADLLESFFLKSPRVLFWIEYLSLSNSYSRSASSMISLNLWLGVRSRLFEL